MVLEKTGEMARHRSAVMGNQHSTHGSRGSKNFWIGKSDNLATVSVQNIDRWLQPTQTIYN